MKKCFVLLFSLIAILAFNPVAIADYSSLLSSDSNTGDMDNIVSEDGGNPEVYVTQGVKRSSKLISAYAGGAFGLSGMAFNMNGGTNGDQTITNGFIANGALLTLDLRFGVEFTPYKLYFALEGIGSFNFGVGSGASASGTVGSSNAVTTLNVGDGAGAFQYVGINFKPGFTFNNKKGAIYAIVGCQYAFMTGSYTSPTSSTTSTTTSQGTFDVSNIRLNYGVGLKHEVYDHIAVFMEFNSLAPIGVSNGTLTPTNGNASSESISAYETYSFLIGVDVKV